MTEDHRYSVSVAGVIVNDEGRALIIQRRDNGHWEPPGGVLEHGETIEDGLRREVYEETGLSVDIGLLSGIYQNMHRNIIALVFRCDRHRGSPRATSEAISYRWATASEARELMAEAYAVRVLDALNCVHPVARPHDGVRLMASGLDLSFDGHDP